MKKVKYGYDELRRFLVLFGVVLVLGYFILYVIGHWELLVRFWESNSQAEINRVISQLRHKTILNFVVLVILTAVTAAIPFMSNAIFAIFNGVVYGPWPQGPPPKSRVDRSSLLPGLSRLCCQR